MEGEEDTAKVLARLVQSWLQSLFLAARRRKERKAKGKPHLTISRHHVFSTCLGGHLSFLVQSETAERWWGKNYP